MARAPILWVALAALSLGGLATPASTLVRDDLLTPGVPQVFVPVRLAIPDAPRGIIANGARSSRLVALTFDADLTPYMARQLDDKSVSSYADTAVIDELRAAGAPATIFATGLWANRYSDILGSLVHNRLFEFENHSWSHPGFESPCFDLAEVHDKRDEVLRAQAFITSIVGRAPRYFRFPGGCASASDAAFVSSLGLRPIGWDVVSGDAYLRDPDEIVTQVLATARGGSIVVMHLDGPARTPATANALPRIIWGLRDRGYELVRLDRLLATLPSQRER